MRSLVLLSILALTLMWVLPASGQIPYPFMTIQEIQQVKKH